MQAMLWYILAHALVYEFAGVCCIVHPCIVQSCMQCMWKLLGSAKYDLQPLGGVLHRLQENYA